jgi:hypothetical protein
MLYRGAHRLGNYVLQDGDRPELVRIQCAGRFESSSLPRFSPVVIKLAIVVDAVDRVAGSQY